jgi:hypothetical protein
MPPTKTFCFGNARSRCGLVDPYLEAFDESARNVTGDVDPLRAILERSPEAAPFSIGAGSRPLRAQEKIDHGPNASPVIAHPAIMV